MRPLRNPIIQGLLAWTLARWMGLCFATIRWTHENRIVAEEVWARGGGALCTFWHSRVALSPVCWPLDRAQPVKGLISLSADGEFIARAVAMRGIPAVRGSSANKDKADRAKGGMQALRDGLRQLKVGALAITPDGPRGPANVMAEGVAVLSKLSGAPVLFIGLSCNPAIRLGSWDRAVLPLPFARGAIVWDIAHFPADAETGDVIADWTARLNAVEARADAITGLERAQ
ncbi:DUF374 domain-containing protein [Rhizobium sp. CRIBSB]|nr:DUF374 domain-containing protein [Rhizobium sp. CRIBSB]